MPKVDMQTVFPNAFHIFLDVLLLWSPTILAYFYLGSYVVMILQRCRLESTWYVVIFWWGSFRNLTFCSTGPNKPTEIEQLMKYLGGSFARNWYHFFAPATTTEIVASPFFATICGWSRKIAHRRSTARALLGQAERNTISKLKQNKYQGLFDEAAPVQWVHGHWFISNEPSIINL